MHSLRDLSLTRDWTCALGSEKAESTRPPGSPLFNLLQIVSGKTSVEVVGKVKSKWGEETHKQLRHRG